MNVEALISRYPRLFHMAEDGSWESIRERGLLSTTALLDLFEVEGERRRTIESHRRPEISSVEHPGLGAALIRDNKPMQEASLRRCLEGMSPREWYETLNRRVFFWVEWVRLMRFLNARSYRKRPHVVLEVDTAGLVERHAERISLSRINSGSTRGCARRGPDTFRRIADYPEGKPIVELAVDSGVRDIAELVLSVSRWRGDELLKRVWNSPEEGRA